MKKILIMGKSSYIGTAVEIWMNHMDDLGLYQIDTWDTVGCEWKKKEMSGYNVVLHVAGIVHQKESSKNLDLYDKVNHLLALEVYEKCIQSGVGQFIFLSTGAVFGQNDRKHKEIIIRKKMRYQPQTEYGKSKRRAEKGLLNLRQQYGESEGKNTITKLVILRPPMIYGDGAKGNYSRLVKLAKVLSVFPDIENMRSMLHIDNLCECIRLIIEKGDEGIFHPQNKDYVVTSQMVHKLGMIYGRNIYLIKLFNPFLMFLGKRIDIIHKVFGSYIYEKELSDFYEWKYCVRQGEQ